ncbi:orotate phosphoribosyltransferase [Lactobacillus sp. DCY120]|uniref:Orotate phosphoribosyltransferase n=1 Tax=Bombilactobacillus apium TaxID=2675299 RepID=A0A850R2C8_9LACO|nr:orotate phosphoribosyltransferase [Bombilactobacillus apium]NVY96500.1 orotate phosphoribosyltransferase [Bombilactobacillus apium]
MNETTANQIAQDLLKIDAVRLNLYHPFTWASGIKSPIYTDNRKTIAYPQVRDHIAEGLAQLIQNFYPQATIIAGVATAGIPHAALAADRLALPLSYVRPKPKDHGTNQQVEGSLPTAQDQVVIIDDLISTGGSALKAVDVVRKTGAEVAGVAAIFSYELPDSQTNFTQAQTTLQTLTSYSHLLHAAHADGQFTKAEFNLLAQWQADPWHWQAPTK